MFLLLSVSFFALATTPDPNQQLAGKAAAAAAMEEGKSGEEAKKAAAEAMAAYGEARNRDEPLLNRYLDWVTGYATLQWGWSYAYEKPVKSVLFDAAPVTMAYVVPALLLSWGASVFGGIYAALRRGTALDRFGRAASYFGLGIPAIILVKLLQARSRTGGLTYPQYDAAAGPFALSNADALAIPAAIVAFSMLAVQWRVVRSESLELVDEPFVTALRADGAGGLRLGRHVLKNATAPLLAVFNAEVLSALFLTMYVVESFLGIPGLGSVTLAAFEERDIGLVLATVLLPAFVGLLGNFVVDVVSAVVDPRVASS